MSIEIMILFTHILRLRVKHILRGQPVQYPNEKLVYLLFPETGAYAKLSPVKTLFIQIFLPPIPYTSIACGFWLMGLWLITLLT